MEMIEQVWTGPLPDWAKLVPNKPLLDYNGQPMWAEFIALRELEAIGWEGVWVNNWCRATWRNPGENATLPAVVAAFFDRIAEHTGRRGGAWDICAWRGDELLFVELKQRNRDKLRPTQLAWMKCAVEEGIPPTSFVVVEWRIDQ
jgi:hypothetical protein